MEELTKKEIVNRAYKIEELGMDCTSTQEALKANVKIKELREAFNVDRNVIKGAINDISLYV
jgi:hypothetical protein